MIDTNMIQQLIPIPTSIGATQYLRARFRRTGCRYHPRVNGRFCFVFTSWDLDLPHQTHPQNPIHTSLARFSTM